MKAVIDTNVLLVANGQHPDVSPGCVLTCVQHLQAMQAEGVTVIDDGHRILDEYLHKTQVNRPKGVGDLFLKWLLRQTANPERVEQVRLTETRADNGELTFAEFPDAALQPRFDPSDRKFAAVAHAHPEHPPIWEAADCKWLDWWPALKASGVTVEFLCPEDTCHFHATKFPGQPTPPLPAPSAPKP